MMNLIRLTFNNREIALIFWLLLFIVWTLFIPKIRSSGFKLLIGLTNKWILIPILSMIFYVTFLFYVFYLLDLWDMSLMKESIIWTFGTAFIILMRSNNSLKDKNHFKKMLLINFKLVLIFEFIFNLYVFGLLTEIIMLPILTFLLLINSFKETSLTEKKIINSILLIFLLVYLSILIYKMSNNFESYINNHRLKLFTLPIVMTILFIPFAYLFSLQMLYQSLFVRLKFIFKQNEELLKFAKNHILKTCHLNFARLKIISKETNFFDIKSKNDLRVEIKRVMNEN